MTNWASTKGWHYEGHIVYGDLDEDGFSRSLIANIIDGSDEDGRLIAAAPDMLDALRNVRDWAKTSGLIQHDSMLGEDIEAAIVKAEGTEKPAPRRP